MGKLCVVVERDREGRADRSGDETRGLEWRLYIMERDVHKEVGMKMCPESGGCM